MNSTAEPLSVAPASSQSSATNSTWPRQVSALSIATQTTRAVSGQRLKSCLISPCRAARCPSSQSLLASRKRYSCWTSSKFSSGSAEVSMSKTNFAMERLRGKRDNDERTPVHTDQDMPYSLAQGSTETCQKSLAANTAREFKQFV